MEKKKYFVFVCSYTVILTIVCLLAETPDDAGKLLGVLSPFTAGLLGLGIFTFKDDFPKCKGSCCVCCCARRVARDYNHPPGDAGGGDMATGTSNADPVEPIDGTGMVQPVA